MMRLRTWTLDEGLEYIRTQPDRHIDGYLVENALKESATRLRMFASGQLTCVRCGLKGNHWHVERGSNDHVMPFSVNLYGIGAKGKEIMLTWDHRIPRSLGGSDRIENAQVMCAYCNQNKGNRLKLREMVEIGIHPSPLLIWRPSDNSRYLDKTYTELHGLPKKGKGVEPRKLKLEDLVEIVEHEFANLGRGVGALNSRGAVLKAPVDSTGQCVLEKQLYRMIVTHGPFTDQWEGVCHQVGKNSAVLKVTHRVATLNGEKVERSTPIFFSVPHRRLIPVEGTVSCS